MFDRKKVIKGLECCKWSRQNVKPEKNKCDECPYKDQDIMNAFAVWRSCTNVLAIDALSLLKEQEQAMKEKDGTISNLISQIKEISQCYERVVRCKDCKYFDGEGCNNVSSICKGIDTYADWFCAEGRKKDE